MVFIRHSRLASCEMKASSLPYVGMYMAMCAEGLRWGGEIIIAAMEWEGVGKMVTKGLSDCFHRIIVPPCDLERCIGISESWESSELRWWA